MEKRKIFLIVITAIVAVAVIAVGAFYYINNYNNEQFESNLVKAYSSYTDLSSKMDKYNHYQQSMDAFKMGDVEKGTKTLEDIEKTNNETRTYLKDCLKSANDDVEKKYINLLINQTDLIGNSLDIEIQFFKFKEMYINGKISGTAHNNEMNKLTKQENSTFKKVDENSKHIDDLLNENPDFQNRLYNMNIGMEFMGGSFINSLFLANP